MGRMILPNSRRQLLQGSLILAGLGLLSGCQLLPPQLQGQVQPPPKVPRLGFLGPSADHPLAEAFRQGLRELGWVEGQNIAIEYRPSEGRSERLPHLAAELVRLPVDVLVAGAGNQGALAAKQATDTIPIVFTGGGGDPVGAGLVASLARPGGNVTGLASLAGTELWGKQLDLLKEAVPGISRVGFLWNPDLPSADAF